MNEVMEWYYKDRPKESIKQEPLFGSVNCLQLYFFLIHNFMEQMILGSDVKNSFLIPIASLESHQFHFQASL